MALKASSGKSGKSRKGQTTDASKGPGETQDPGPILHVHFVGGMANRMIQYMVVRRIAAEVPGCRISNAVLPEWGIDHPPLAGAPDPRTNIPVSRGDVDIAGITNLLSSGTKTSVNFKSYAQWFPNFPDLDLCRKMFKPNEDHYAGFGPEHLVCNVRGAEVLDADFAHYVLLPLGFYSELARTTGLKLVFMGQIEDNAYCDALKQHFPDAIFHPSRGAMSDFQTFRNSRNLVPAVSTFSWLAAWLSRADMIVLPIDGMFNPLQCPAVDLLPYPDARYRYYLFPKNYSVPVEQFEKGHQVIDGNWCRVSPETVASLRRSVYRRPERFSDQFLAMFNEAFYLKANADVARLVAAGRLKSGFDHYFTYGFSEGRPCFPFDSQWYGANYPNAAREVEEGNYQDLLHHYVLAGAAGGYQPRARPILDVHLIGGFADRMIQYMVARRVAAEVGECDISNAALPEWGICHPHIPPVQASERDVPVSSAKVDVSGIATVLFLGVTPRVNLKSFAHWFSNFPDLDLCRSMFEPNQRDYPGFGSEYLVCYIELPEGNNPHHVLLPFEFYAELAQSTGLKLVFMGQIGENPYCQGLRSHFPDAVFQPSQGAIRDFQTFRNSTNLVPAVSTFSWLAAWLSHADRIVLAVNGMFHPVQDPGIDLLPLQDERYSFCLFPINYAVPIDRFEKSHRALQCKWRYVHPEALSKLRTARRPKTLQPFVSFFDESFYLRTNRDVADAVKAKGLESGLDHYVKAGFREGRDGFAFDSRWYSMEYPLAALEVGQGDYVDLLHHYVEVGAKRGYKPTPRPILDLQLTSGFAENMLQYMAACHIAARVDGCQISNANLPEWGIDHPALPGAPGPAIETMNFGRQIDLRSTEGLLRSGASLRASLISDAQWLANFPDLDCCRSIFPARRDEYPGFGAECLVCNIEVHQDSRRRPHHVLLPLEFYEEVARNTGLKLVFMGQLEGNEYGRALKERFPYAAFHPTRGAMEDFQTFRNSTNLVPAVSPFSWLASWLSQADMVIFPVNGLFHPAQEPSIDLLPCGDERYRFYLFPINYAVPVDRFEEAHHALRGAWRYVGSQILPELRVPRWPKRLDRYISMFNEAFYLRTYRDVAEAVRAGGLANGLEHYVKRGFEEGHRRCFPLDDRWYSAKYPLAAFEVGQGDYADLSHHYVEVGAIRGYRPVPN